MALALPVFSFDRLTFEMPTSSLSWLRLIFLSAITRSSLMIIAIESPPSDGVVCFLLQEGAVGEYAAQQE